MKETFNFLRDVCSIAYSNNSYSIQKRLRADSVNHVYHAGTDADAYVIWKGDMLVIHFVGTQSNWKDVIANFLVFPKRLEKGVYVHRGYQKRVDLLYTRLRNACATQEPSKVWITGDSLGGGMARAFYHKLQQESRGDFNLFTIGTPAMGNKKFNMRVSDANTHHFLLDKDPIRLLPMWLFGFSHPKNMEILATDFKKYAVSNHHPKNYTF